MPEMQWGDRRRRGWAGGEYHVVTSVMTTWGSSFTGIRTMPWRAAAIVARLSWCCNDGDSDIARLDHWEPLSHRQEPRESPARDFSDAVFSVRSTRFFKSL